MTHNNIRKIIYNSFPVNDLFLLYGIIATHKISLLITDIYALKLCQLTKENH